MKIKYLLSLVVFLTSCSENIFFEKPKMNHSTDKNLKEDFTSKCTEVKNDSITCEFTAFDIKVSNIPGMATELFANETYKWIINNVFYGNEIYSLSEIEFDGNSRTGSSFGSYLPALNKIMIYPNNTAVTGNNVVSKFIAKKFGKDSIDPTKDLDYWKYTLSHEYGHHQTVTYGTTGILKTEDWNGETLYDVTINEKGKKFLDLTGIAKTKEYKDKTQIQKISIFSGGTPENPWPLSPYYEIMNEYLWTDAELLTRTLQLRTFVVPKELQNKNSVSPFGEIINDYWWLKYYNSNLYETHKDKARKPIQEPVNEDLAEWAEFMDNEWFNDDALFGNIYASEHGGLFISSTKQNQKLTISNDYSFADFTELQRFTSTRYNLRPFDSRKSKEIILESVVYELPRVKKGSYILKSGRIRVRNGFDLKNQEEKKVVFRGEVVYIIKNTKKGIEIEAL